MAGKGHLIKPICIKYMGAHLGSGRASSCACMIHIALLPAAYGGILARIRMGPTYSTSGVSDSARKAVADSEELKRSTLLQSFASVHMWAFAEKTGRMGDLPVSLCFYNRWNTATWAVRCRPLHTGNLPKLAAACISLFASLLLHTHTQLFMVNCTLRLAWCCRQTQQCQQIPMMSLVYLM